MPHGENVKINYNLTDSLLFQLSDKKTFAFFS